MEGSTILEYIKVFFEHWQTLVGAFLGASAPFLLWWFAEKYRKHIEQIQYLYYLQRMIVDQINLLIDARETVEKFLNQRIKTLITHIDENPSTAYSANTAFFPLFSVRSLPDDINKISSGSGYIDNKVAKIFSLSRDFPHIIEDIRLQLRDTIERNDKIAFGKLNSPEVQKNQFKENILEYERMINEDLLKINIPLYLRKLVEALIAVQYKTRINSFLWKVKFDPFWKFYFKKSIYLAKRGSIITDMDKFFEQKVKKQLADIEKSNSNYKQL